MFKLFNCLVQDQRSESQYPVIIVESDDCPSDIDENEVHLFGYSQSDLEDIISNGGIIPETGEILIDFAVYDEY